MKKWNLDATVTISINTIVEANTLEEAIKIGDERCLCSVIPSNIYSEEEFWVCGEELDGSPNNINGEPTHD